MARDKTKSNNTYWRLDQFGSFTKPDVMDHITELTKQHFSIWGKKTTLVDALVLLERGLLDYSKCTRTELVKFATDRKLLTASKASKEELVHGLEQADKERRFEKFIDMPPELRVRIYGYYVAGFSKLLYTPAQPPLSLTCSLIRKEILPVFYSSREVVFKLTYTTYGRKEFQRIKIEKDSKAFLKTLAQDNCADIRDLAFEVVEHWANCRSDRVFDCVRVVLDHGDAAYKIETGDISDYLRVSEKEKRQRNEAKVKAEIYEILERAKGPDGKVQLQVQDIRALHEVVATGYT